MEMAADRSARRVLEMRFRLLRIRSLSVSLCFHRTRPSSMVTLSIVCFIRLCAGHVLVCTSAWRLRFRFFSGVSEQGAWGSWRPGTGLSSGRCFVNISFSFCRFRFLVQEGKGPSLHTRHVSSRSRAGFALSCMRAKRAFPSGTRSPVSSKARGDRVC